MLSDIRRVGVFIACVGGGLSLSAVGGEGDRPQQDRLTKIKRVAPGTIASVSTGRTPRTLVPLDPVVHEFGGQGSVAGVLTPVTVYDNGLGNRVWQPGANERMADDLLIVGGGCNIVSYDLVVVGFPAVGTPTFDVQTALWNGEPCRVGSSIIAGTEADFVGLLQNQTLQRITAIMDAPVAIPEKVWLAATFSTDDSGWLIGNEAELGFTEDFFSEDDATLGCLGGFFLPDVFTGFSTTLQCGFDPPPSGGCCNDATCSESTEAVCTSAGGVWQGPSTTCNPDPCAPQFPVYRNDGSTNAFAGNATDTLTADDILLAPGSGGCELSRYDLNVFGPSGTGTFDVTASLWTANPDPDPAVNGLPFEQIPGTEVTFTGIPDGFPPTTLHSPLLSGITIPERIWMVMSTTTPDSGWLTGGEASIGFTGDFFANGVIDVLGGVTWTAVEFSDPTLFDGLRSNVFCRGLNPVGACCSDAAGTCVDQVIELDCDGRWMPNITCDAAEFVPACGTNACCTEFGCQDLTRDLCLFNFGLPTPGLPIPGQSCPDETGAGLCPRASCFNATGDCSVANGTPGCDDPICCETVCAIDAMCCMDNGGVGWDAVCSEDAQRLCSAALSNDNCADAETIAVGLAPGTGSVFVDFDTTDAMTDGAPHKACINAGNDEQITNDLWFRFVPDQTGEIFIRTCGLSGVDTKIAVYVDSGICPPTGVDLRVCNDDLCLSQSMVILTVEAGQTYLIRVGTFPGTGNDDRAAGGPGQFEMAFGRPPNAACPSSLATNCCQDTGGTPACGDTTCCQTVCACDSFCCEVEWDDQCATGGACSAANLCPAECGGTCPVGVVTFDGAPDRVMIDARQVGADEILATGPVSVGGGFGCWSLCETGDGGDIPNDITVVTTNSEGHYRLTLARPVTPSEVTTIRYTDDLGGMTTLEIIAHPANVNGDGITDTADVAAIRACLDGSTVCELWQCDIDQSGQCGPGDVLRVIDLLQGGDQFANWRNTSSAKNRNLCPN